MKKVSDILNKKTNLTSLKFDKKSYSNVSFGCYLKSSKLIGKTRHYYKLSNYDSYRGVFGYESINELIVSRILDCLNIEHLKYKLINADLKIENKILNTYISDSIEYKRKNERAISFENYYVNYKKDDESPIDFIKRIGFTDYLDDLLFVDYLIFNRDRHGANIEVLISDDNKIRFSPLFDHGLSLLLNDLDNKNYVTTYDIFKSEPANNFFGTRSTYENLKFITNPSKYKNYSIKDFDFDYIFYGIDKFIPKYTIMATKKMIKGRYNVWKNL